MLKKFTLLIVLALSLMVVLSAQAQDSQQDVPLQAVGVWENNLYVYGPFDALNLTPDGDGNFTNPVWRGNTLAYIQLDENYVGNLWVSVDMQAPFLLMNGLDTLYPVSFTPDGLLLYALANPNNNSQSESTYLLDLFTITPVNGAVPTFIGSFGNEDMGIGCGGGSSLPTDWQHWAEVGFGGQSVVLQMTAYGILHSMDCVGERTGLLDLATGTDVELGQSFGIAALSPDGSTLAGRIWNRATTPSAQLATIDLRNLEVQTYATAGIPDQITWSADGASLFYSTQQMLDTLIPMTDGERDALINLRAILPEASSITSDPPTGGFPLFSVGIRRFDLASGDESVIYEGTDDAFSVGRMFALSDKDVLVFSQIPNLQVWIAAIASGQFDLNGAINTRQEQIATVPVSVFALNLGTQQLTTINVGVSLYTPNLAAPSPSTGSKPPVIAQDTIPGINDFYLNLTTNLLVWSTTNAPAVHLSLSHPRGAIIDYGQQAANGSMAVPLLNGDFAPQVTFWLTLRDTQGNDILDAAGQPIISTLDWDISQ